MENKLQENARKLVNQEIFESVNMTCQKEIRENPELLNESKNYYPTNEEGKKDVENGDYPEIYEFWSVTEWLADKLEEKGEIIFDCLDFIVWGRRTTGQAIKIDGVIQEIAKKSYY